MTILVELLAFLALAATAVIVVIILRATSGRLFARILPPDEQEQQGLRQVLSTGPLDFEVGEGVLVEVLEGQTVRAQIDFDRVLAAVLATPHQPCRGDYSYWHVNSVTTRVAAESAAAREVPECGADDDEYKPDIEQFSIAA